MKFDQYSKPSTPAIMTRRRTILGAAALPFGAGLTSIIPLNDASACHQYVSPLDGAKGCSSQKRDASSPKSKNTSRQQSSKSSSSEKATGLIFQDEIVGFNRGKHNSRSRPLRISRAPDGKNSVEARYQRGIPACATSLTLDLFEGDGVNHATFECDLWFSNGFRGPAGKLFGVYGGNNAGGGLVNKKPGCSNTEGGWSMRVVHSKDNRIYLYSYAQNRTVSCRGDKKFGQTKAQPQKFATNRWVKFRQEIIMNTPGRSDGRLRLWMDGASLFDWEGIMYQNKANKYGIKGWFISNMFGGSCNRKEFFPTANMSVWYRNLKVYTGGGPSA